MKTDKKVVIVIVGLGFVLILIGLVTPGWLSIKLDYQAIREREASLRDRPWHKRYSVFDTNRPQLSSMRIAIGPFYIRYCLSIQSLTKYPSDTCLTMSSVDIISILKQVQLHQTTNDPFQSILESVNSGTREQFPFDTVINVYTVIIAVCAVVLAQCFLSVCLSGWYVYKEHPSTKLGISGGICLILSGVLSALMVAVYLWEHAKTDRELTKSDLQDVFQFQFPYSSIICLTATVLFFVAALLLIRMTRKSEHHFNHEMLVMDDSKSGNTYVVSA